MPKPAPPRSADFDGDGLDDLVVGVRMKISLPQFGVRVTYSKTGTTSTLFGQGPGFLYPSTYGPFGKDTAAGDFNADGFLDLAVGDGFQEPESFGGVWIFEGSATGLKTTPVTNLRRSDFGPLDGLSGFGGGFGTALAVGDLDRDGYNDLAVGDMNDETTTDTDAGSVAIYFGSAVGLTPGNAVRVHKLAFGIGTSVQGTDNLGQNLAIVDINGDGRPELLALSDSDVVVIRFPASRRRIGGSGGLTASSIRLAGVPGLSLVAPWAPDSRMNAMSSGDVNGDGYQDVVLGLSETNVDGFAYAGSLVVLRGGPSGLSAQRSQIITLSTPSVPGVPVMYGHFAASVAVADLTGDRIGDVLAGAPQARTPSSADAPYVLFLPGSPAGLAGSGSVMLSDTTPGFTPYATAFSEFGSDIAILERNGLPGTDIVIGASQWDPPSPNNFAYPAGALVYVSFASGTFTVTGAATVEGQSDLDQLGTSLISR